MVTAFIAVALLHFTKNIALEELQEISRGWKSHKIDGLEVGLRDTL